MDEYERLHDQRNTTIDMAMMSQQQDSRLPLIGQVIRYIPNQELIMCRTLDIEEDPFLEDHLFVNARGVKAPSECLPVVPFTISLEIMAEVAACLAPGQGLLGFEHISAQEWIQLEKSTLDLNMVAKVHPSESLDTTIVFVQIFKNGQSKPAIQGKVLFGSHYRINLDLSFSELNHPYDSPYTQNRIYQEGYLFHGPQFQVVGSQPKFGDRGVKGNLLVREKASMFQSNPNPELLTDPLLMDGVGQFIGLWAMERDWYVFPIGVDKIEFYQPTPPVGTLAPLRGEITQSNVRFFSSNIEVQDGSGSVWFRVRGWKKWIFRWEKKLVHFRRQPTHFCASEKLPLKEKDEIGRVRHLAKKGFVDLDLSIIARNYLSQKEMGHFEAIMPQPRVAERWLMERIVAKDAAREWLSISMGTATMRHPASFEMNQQDGVFLAVGFPEEVPPIRVESTENDALAILSQKSFPIAVHTVEPESSGSIEIPLTKNERALLDAYPKEEREILALRMCCAKEVLCTRRTEFEPISRVFPEMTRVKSTGEVEFYFDFDQAQYRTNTILKGDFILAYLMNASAPAEMSGIPQNHPQTMNGTI